MLTSPLLAYLVRGNSTTWRVPDGDRHDKASMASEAARDLKTGATSWGAPGSDLRHAAIFARDLVTPAAAENTLIAKLVSSQLKDTANRGPSVLGSPSGLVTPLAD